MGAVIEVIGLFAIGTIAAHFLIDLCTQAVMRLGSDHLPGPRPPVPPPTEAPDDFDADHSNRPRLGR